jgi:hypothetical protein
MAQFIHFICTYYDAMYKLKFTTSAFTDSLKWIR